MTTFEKEVSGAEKFMIAINELRPPFVIQLVLEGPDDPDPEALYDALELTTAANPGSSLVLDRSGPYEMWKLGPEPTLTVVDAPDFLGQSAEEAPFFMWALDAYRGPTCELVLVRGASKNYLVFRAAHAVMDGQGTIAWVKDFMRCLRGEAPLGHPSTLGLDQLIRDIRAEIRKVPEPDALHPFGKPSPSSQGGYGWRRVHIERPLDPKASGRIAVALAERARAGGVEGVVRINLPTDLRRYRPEERTTGNFFSSLELLVPPGATPDLIGLKVIQMLYKNEGVRPVALYEPDEAGSLNIHRAKVLWDLAHLHDTGLYAFSASLSHLGALKSEELGAPNFRPTGAFFVPLVGDSGCVVHINGFDQCTEVTVGLSDRFSEGGGLEDLAEIVRRALGDSSD